MTPQSFSYATVGSNKMIYCPPYGLTESLNYMIKIDPLSYEITKIPLKVDKSKEKWEYGIVVNDSIVFLPYNESKILILNTSNDSVEYIDVKIKGTGKYIKSHRHKNKIIALPYGEWGIFNHLISLDIDTKEVILKEILCPIDDQKKWHTTQYLNGKIYGVPRGERWDENYFPYIIELDCDSLDYQLIDMSSIWADYDQEKFTNKKYTTLAKVGNKLYAPPYSENPNFDIILKFDGSWKHERTGLKTTSRKYYTHYVSNNGKIYCPPAGHNEDWSDMLVIDTKDDSWKTVPLGLGKESKKYFAGCENSQGKIYYIPRGGCVCDPVENWKSQGDLAEVLVINTKNDSFYSIDISKYFQDNTTIEKFNCCVIVDDKIFAMPYGQSDSFQNILVFDTISEKVIKEIDLNEI
jgi:hypothetical protein